MSQPVAQCTHDAASRKPPHNIGTCHTGPLTSCELKQMLLLASCHQTCMTHTTAVWEPPGHRQATSWVHCTTIRNTQSSTSEDGPEHAEPIGITNKPLLLHPGVLLYQQQFQEIKNLLASLEHTQVTHEKCT